MNNENIFCHDCGEKILRFYFQIGEKKLCNRCLQEKYRFEVPKKEK